MGHDIIPSYIWEGPLKPFLEFLKSLHLPHPQCKEILFEYARYHDIYITEGILEETCPEENFTHGREK